MEVIAVADNLIAQFRLGSGGLGMFCDYPEV